MNLMISETALRPSPAATGGFAVDIISCATGECALGAVLVARSIKGVCAILLGDDHGELESDLAARFPQATLVASEMLTHGWDLARATGQQMPTDDVDVEQVLTGMKRSLRPEARKPGFGPEVQSSPDAPPIDRLAAFLGRQP